MWEWFISKRIPLFLTTGMEKEKKVGKTKKREGKGKGEIQEKKWGKRNESEN